MDIFSISENSDDAEKIKSDALANHLSNLLIHDKYVNTLDLSNSCLENLSNVIGNFTNLTSLNLSNNKLISLPLSVTKLHNLTLLNISHNKFNRIPNVLFTGLRDLTVLDVSFNNISAIKEDLACSPNIIEFRISNNRLTEMPSCVISIMNNLKILDISSNPLQVTDFYKNSRSCSKNTRLQKLNIENCNFVYETLNFLPCLGSLEELSLGNTNYPIIEKWPKNYLGSIKIDFFKSLKKLKMLSLKGACISVLPSKFDCWNDLQVLDVSKNKLSWLPEEICSLINLEILFANSNELQFLPSNIGCLKNLKEIYLSQNKIQKLPKSFSKLESLKFIDLYDNEIQVIELSILSLLSLKGVDLERNFLKQEWLENANNLLENSYFKLRNNFRRHFNINESERFVSQKVIVNENVDSNKLFLDSKEEEKGGNENSLHIFPNFSCQLADMNESWENTCTTNEHNLFDPNGWLMSLKFCIIIFFLI